MNKLKKITTLLLISYQLIIGQTLLYATDTNGITSEERTADDIKEMMKDSDPSDIPFIDYLEDFIPDQTQPIKEYDLSQFNGKKIYIGYGIYDGAEKYCKFVEAPTNPPEGISEKFENIKVFNNRTYGISKEKLTYAGCEALVRQYTGIVAVPTNSGENSFIGSFGKDKWLGIFKANCGVNYSNEEGTNQQFFNWAGDENAEICETNLLNVHQEKRAWRKATGVENYYCMIEIFSPDPERPVKICAPWWRVERKYVKPDNLNVGGINLGTINQADIPELYNVCTVLDEAGTEVAESTQTQEISCTTYYDAFVAEGCLENIYQKICFVSECNGYVENACFHKEEVKPLKDYTKVTVLIAGTEKQVKGKAQIRTQIYDCPVSVPESSNCLEKSTVIAYPQECPGSQCKERKDCVFSAENSDIRKQCEADYPCEKLYPTLDITPTYDGGGNLKFLHRHCADGTTLDFPVNIESKLNKTCVEYSQLTKTDEITKNCLLDRAYKDFTIDMSITGVDIYENDPMCIRMNNLVDSRPLQEIVLDLTYNSSAIPVISKAIIDGTTEIVYTPDDATDAYSIASATAYIKMVGDTSGSASTDDQQGNCPFSESWGEKIINRLSGNNAQQKYTGGSNITVTATTLTITDCNNYASSIGGSGRLSGTTCTVTLSATSDDKTFKLIKKSGTGGDPGEEYPLGTFTSKSNSVSVDTCNLWAQCLQGTVTSNQDGGAVTCTIQQNDTRVAPPNPPQISAEGQVSDCRPVEGLTDQITSDFDGLKDIFFIEDVVGGMFGYTSNYLLHPYQDNVVKIDGKEAFPLDRIHTIDDNNLKYNVKIRQTSIMAKKINPKVALAGGATVAGAVALEALKIIAIGVPGLIVVIAIVVILILLFQDATKYNEESIFWILYKDIPKTEYITNVYSINGHTYDGRYKMDLGTKWRMVYALSGEDPGTNLNWDFRNFTGTLEVPDFNTMLDNWFKAKQQNWACLGFMLGSGTPPSTPMERGVVVGYPKCKWYKVNCNKRNSETFQEEKDITKKMNGFYIGAVNALTIVVPYMGDYEVEAYDKNNELLGSITVLEDDFLTETATELANAQLNFGLNMSLANGINDGAREKACREDYMVEWGGGVSGIYAEEEKTSTSVNCQKSNDNYVKDHAMTKLKIRSTSVDDWFIITLSRPMPYANKARLVSLNNKETREYRCYEPFGECGEDDFIVQEGE